MIRIGIIGAENSHSSAIARTLNVAKAVPGARVVAIWGETDEFAAKAATAGQIPTIVKQPTDMLGMIDAVVVDHRHARYHLPAVEPFLKIRMPMFVDKPFSYRLAEGRDFLARARKARVPVTSFSVTPLQQAFVDYRKKLVRAGKVLALSSYGPCDVDSKYGGIFFYGIHQVELLLALVPDQPQAVAVTRLKGGKEAVAAIFFPELTVSMHCLDKGWFDFQVAAVTENGPRTARIASDSDPYLTGIRTWVKMFKTGQEPRPHDQILRSIAVLEAMEKSVPTGKVVPVEKV